MTDLKPIPLSAATTAWELCEDVKRAIAEEPARADMHVFASHRSPVENGPACGTVGCFAGWLCLLRGEPVERTSSGAIYLAKQILGTGVVYDTVPASNDDDDDAYYSDENKFVFNAGEGDACSETIPGTRAHADAVIARIDHFMAVNAERLKAKKLSPRAAARLD